MSKPEVNYSQPQRMKSPNSLLAIQIVLGIMTLSLACLTLVYPGSAAIVISVWLSVSLLFAGIQDVVVGAGASYLSKGMRAVSFGVGIAAMIVSVGVLLYPGAAVLATLFLLAVGLLFLGSGAIARGIIHKRTPTWARVMLIEVGAMTVVSGFIIMVYPVLGISVLFTLLEVVLVINGASYIAAGATFRAVYYAGLVNPEKHSKTETQ